MGLIGNTKTWTGLQGQNALFDLIDIWRDPTLRQFTWRKSDPRKMRRLDYLLIPNDLQFEVKNCEILAPYVITLLSF